MFIFGSLESTCNFLLVLIEFFFSLAVTVEVLRVKIDIADFLQAKCDFKRQKAVLRFCTPLGLRGNV